jgi:putative oxidoreductase
MIRNRILLILFRLAVGGVFIYSGILKIVDPLGFAQNIMNYKVLPPGPCLLVALVLPWMEALAGLGLVSGIFRKTSAGIISIMLVGFIGLVAVTMIRGLNVDCGCFGGTFSRKADWRLIVEDAVLLFMALQHVLDGVRSKGPNGKKTSCDRPG